jgi:hypothetical protein
MKRSMARTITALFFNASKFVTGLHPFSDFRRVACGGY